MNLENIILNKISMSQKEKQRITPCPHALWSSAGQRGVSKEQLAEVTHTLETKGNGNGEVEKRERGKEKRLIGNR